MSKYHSTMSRRSFMKVLGLAGAGLGAAAATAPVFHDLDELTSSKGSHPEMRWWIKERDYEDITTPVDWTVFAPYDRDTNPMASSSDLDYQWTELQDQITEAGMKNATPGRSLRDYAFSRGSSFIGPNAPWDGPSASLPGDATGPWTGTPEDNLKTVRAAIHSYGCKTVGALGLNEHMKRLFDAGRRGPIWDSSLDSYEGYRDDDGVYHIPDKCRYMLTFATKQNAIQNLYALSENPNKPGEYFHRVDLGSQTVGQAYSHAAQLKYMTMRFIKTLGYGAYSTGIRANVPAGIFSGLGEQGRCAYLCSPDYGLSLRYTAYIITDFPLAPTKPIDGGVMPFCNTCKRCADACVPGAVSTLDDITYDVACLTNRPGHKGWHMDWGKCRSFGSPGRCQNCQSVCPFSHPEDGPIHPLVRAISGTTSIFAGFFAQMDRTMGYGKPKSEEELADWWDRDLSTWKYDTLLGFGQSVW